MLHILKAVCTMKVKTIYDQTGKANSNILNMQKQSLCYHIAKEWLYTQYYIHFLLLWILLLFSKISNYLPKWYDLWSLWTCLSPYLLWQKWFETLPDWPLHRDVWLSWRSGTGREPVCLYLPVWMCDGRWTLPFGNTDSFFLHFCGCV